MIRNFKKILFTTVTLGVFLFVGATKVTATKYVGFEFYIDKSAKTDFSDIKNASFREVNSKSVFELRKAYCVWVKVKKSDSQNLMYMLDQPNIDSVSFIFQNKNGVWEKRNSGNDYVFNHRKIKLNSFVFSMREVYGEYFYLRLKNKVPTSFNILEGTDSEVIGFGINNSILFGLLLGGISVMLCYNLFLYFSVRDKVYLIYSVHTLFVALLQTTLFGYAFQFFWPNTPSIQDYGVEFFTICISVAGLWFMTEFLKIKSFVPQLNKVVNVFYIIYAIALVVLTYDIVVVNFALKYIQPLVALFVIYTGIRVHMSGSVIAKYYLIAWFVFMAGIITYTLSEIGVLERNLFTTLMMPIGSTIEVILLSLALANKINILKQEQEMAVEHSLRLEKEKATLIREQNIQLEEKVEARTLELEKSYTRLEDKNKEVEQALFDLKNAQSQLVNAEKMSSLGQLTAGIAHEINNPINFVSSNIEPLKRDVEDVINLFEQTEEMVRNNLSEEQVNEISQLKNNIDYEYVKEEIANLLRGMTDGANRTVEIIRGLKLFSRIDEDDLKPVDLEEGINSTLILLNSTFKHKIEVKRDFAEIPMVDCYGGKMNQVFMNILSNSGQAILSENPDRTDGVISITTQLQGEDHVVIKIKDNGPGMPEEVQQKIFEPFYTTKPVGEGTGLGLSIVYKIIDKINGEIKVNSEIGVGTEFVLTLPIKNH